MRSNTLASKGIISSVPLFRIVSRLSLWNSRIDHLSLLLCFLSNSNILFLTSLHIISSHFLHPVYVKFRHWLFWFYLFLGLNDWIFRNLVIVLCVFLVLLGFLCKFNFMLKVGIGCGTVDICVNMNDTLVYTFIYWSLVNSWLFHFVFESHIFL